MPRAKTKRENVLAVECARCGAAYVAAIGRGRRSYVHPVPSSKMNHEQAERTRVARCRAWHLRAECVEQAVRDAIIAFRQGPRYYEAFARFAADVEALQLEAEQNERAAERDVTELTRQRSAKIRSLAHAQVRKRAITRRIALLSRQLERARRTWQLARTVRRESLRSDDRLLALTDDVDAIREAWEAGVASRRQLVRAWVARITCFIEPEPAVRAPRLLTLELCVDPDHPILFGLAP